MNQSAKEVWDATVDLFNENNEKVSFGTHWSYGILNDPKRLGFVFSRYKFAAKMVCKDAKVCEMGCSEGIGASILAETAKSYTGIDSDQEAIEAAKKTFPNEKFSFICDDFLSKSFGLFDAIVSLDVIEHIEKKDEDLFFQTILQNLNENGMCVIGTPNITAFEYASEGSKLGHVNMYSMERLGSELRKNFHQVFCFGMNDETVHTGFSSMAHYLICLAFHKK